MQWRDTLNGVSRQFYSPAASEYFAIGEILLRSDIRLTPSEYFAIGEILLRSDIRLTPSEYFAEGEIPLREFYGE